MTMTVVTTRNPSGRVTGFLSSCMNEIAPGVFTAPNMTVAVRERVWRVLESWRDSGTADMAVLMTWSDVSAAGGQAIRVIGFPRVRLVEYEQFVLTWRALPGGPAPHTVP